MIRRMIKNRKLKKHIKRIRFDLIDSDPNWDYYTKSGEYTALKWLKSYVEGRAACEPKELFESMLQRVGYNDSNWQRDYLTTLYRWI